MKQNIVNLNDIENKKLNSIIVRFSVEDIK